MENSAAIHSTTLQILEIRAAFLAGIPTNANEFSEIRVKIV